METSDDRKTKYREHDKDDYLRYDAGWLGSRGSQRVREWRLLERLYRAGEDVRIKCRHGAGDVRRPPQTAQMAAKQHHERRGEYQQRDDAENVRRTKAGGVE
jgi:hypothetical protein